MRSGAAKLFCIFLFVSFPAAGLLGQLSPGDLSDPHSALEGLSGCTKCHELGNKQTNEKCLACHTEIAGRVSAGKGYHSSAAVKGNQCSKCHSEHNGKNFKLIRLDVNSFDHRLTGFPLSVPHAKKECKDCHNTAHISDGKLKNKKATYLGIKSECLTCHEDYHMKTLSPDCLTCHTQDAFTPATGFSHDKARFRLAGKHRAVECQKCHKISMSNGKKFQQFTGLQYVNCASCHKDPHKNQFGQNCRQCHSEESFKVISGNQKFDHNKTDFKLEGRHMIVNCKTCHKGKLTDPLKHDRCNDCHKDYHKGQFEKNNTSPDCSKCHSVNGFKQFLFTVDQHNTGPFPLKGAHLAVPCSECHKKQENWSFRKIGSTCADCHPDIHQNIISSKFYAGTGCTSCHNEKTWSDIKFDHSKTGFNLTGAHSKTLCRNCHFKNYATGTFVQSFSELPTKCTECHKDNHHDQFALAGVTDCTRCHGMENWKASGFDHNKTQFRLDGKHAGVECSKCHKPAKAGASFYIQYKINDFRCETCH